MTRRRRIRDALPESLVPFARNVYLRGRSHRLLTAAAKRSVARRLTGDEQKLLRRVNPNIAWNDSMFNGNRQHYFSVGLDAVRVINNVLRETGTVPRNILDLPSGWGRAMRFFAAQWPDASLTASDIVYDGPLFCAREFGATPDPSATDFDQLNFPDQFDLIFVGSLLTHFGADTTRAILRLFTRSLSSIGTLVLTTLGDEHLRRLEAEGAGDNFDAAEVRRMIQEYQTTGIGFAPYAVPMSLVPEEHELLNESRYGIACTSPAWLEQAAADFGLRRVYFKERGWDDLQDVHGLQVAA